MPPGSPGPRRAVRQYHRIGLLPEPERGADGRRRYGYDDVIRLLWVRKMAQAGIGLDDMRAAFGESRDVGESRDIGEVLGRLEETLAAQEAAIGRRRVAVQRLRAVGSPLGLLSELVTDRLAGLPPDALRPADVDTLLVTERIFGPAGAAFQASTFIVLATHPELRAEHDRLDAAEEALDDSVAPDDPRVKEIAVRRSAHTMALNRAARAAGLDEADERLGESFAEDMTGSGEVNLASATEAVARLPYDWSPARKRCMERTTEIYVAALAVEYPVTCE
ncbi:MerR family transcriptional regulator [Actinoplanes couchii]|uniref:Transcriptional regulator n=1 Tax=Actinoplanes couchii TaxID=403638 RepID=A0ABQ3XAH7_9ACTN|nr:MerR family transcriptional regulator [Actinoplanes couchii]MDR6324888.1 DNA-binding transcriptional MerR regulator [Actinoplanes couchii]GID55490.1 transcriptional regulator [Actinoplanes couchii]